MDLQLSQVLDKNLKLVDINEMILCMVNLTVRKVSMFLKSYSAFWNFFIEVIVSEQVINNKIWEHFKELNCIFNKNGEDL